MNRIGRENKATPCYSPGHVKGLINEQTDKFASRGVYTTLMERETVCEVKCEYYSLNLIIQQLMRLCLIKYL